MLKDTNEVVHEACMFAQHIVVALDCMHETQAMSMIFANKANLPQFKIAPHFYLTSYHAMEYRMQLEIIKLFDKSSRSFVNFEDDLKKNKWITETDIDQFESKWSLYENDIEAIRKRRNKVIAHSDAKYFRHPEIIFETNKIDLCHLEDLLQSMLGICNGIIQSYVKEGIPPLFSTFNGDDFVKLFDMETEAEQKLKQGIF